MYKKVMLTISLLISLQSGHTIAMNNWSGSDCLKGIAIATACYGVVSVCRYYYCYNKAYTSELDAGALKGKLKEMQQTDYNSQNHDVNELYKNILNQKNNKKKLAKSSENFMQSTWYHSFLFSSNMTPRELAKDNIKDWKIEDCNWWKKQPIILQYE